MVQSVSPHSPGDPPAGQSRLWSIPRNGKTLLRSLLPRAEIEVQDEKSALPFPKTDLSILPKTARERGQRISPPLSFGRRRCRRSYAAPFPNLHSPCARSSQERSPHRLPLMPPSDRTTPSEKEPMLAPRQSSSLFPPSNRPVQRNPRILALAHVLRPFQGRRRGARNLRLRFRESDTQGRAIFLGRGEKNQQCVCASGLPTHGSFEAPMRSSQFPLRISTRFPDADKQDSQNSWMACARASCRFSLIVSILFPPRSRASPDPSLAVGSSPVWKKPMQRDARKNRYNLFHMRIRLVDRVRKGRPRIPVLLRQRVRTMISLLDCCLDVRWMHVSSR